MARSKVKLAFISNDSTRKATYKKRRASLVKKIDELTTLCGVEACAVINNSAFDDQPTVWPSAEGARSVIEKFKNVGEMERGKRCVNHESFTKKRIEKMEEKHRKMMAENRDRELVRVMFDSIGQSPMALPPTMNQNDYMDLDRVISQHLWEIQRTMTMRMNESSSSIPPPPPPPTLLLPPPPPPPAFINVGDGANNFGNHFNYIPPPPPPQQNVVYPPYNPNYAMPIYPCPLSFHRRDYPQHPPLPPPPPPPQMDYPPPEMSFSPLPDMGFNQPFPPPNLDFLP